MCFKLTPADNELHHGNENFSQRASIFILALKDKSKAFPYRLGQAHRVPGDGGSQISRKLAHEGGKVVSPTHWSPVPPRKYS
jgi:hypothetical protein